MSTADFTVAYFGPALDDGTMDVSSLAPALLSTGQLFTVANQLINGEKTTIKVNVVATSAGSFKINFALDYKKIVDKAKDFLSSDEVNAATNLKEMVIGVHGLFSLIKFLKNRPAEKVEMLEDGHVKISIQDESCVFLAQANDLHKNKIIREAAAKLVNPLHDEGVDKFEVTSDSHIEMVEKHEVGYFTTIDPNDELVDSISERAFTIVSLTFKEGNKWQLSDGEETIRATIMDSEFLKKVSTSSISFSKGDLLICMLRTRQFLENGKLKTDYMVERVIEHKPAMQQVDLHP